MSNKTTTPTATARADSPALTGSETSHVAAAEEWQDAMHDALHEVWKILWKRDFGIGEDDIFRAIQREAIAHRALKDARQRKSPNDKIHP